MHLLDARGTLFYFLTVFPLDCSISSPTYHLSSSPSQRKSEKRNDKWWQDVRWNRYIVKLESLPLTKISPLLILSYSPILNFFMQPSFQGSIRKTNFSRKLTIIKGLYWNYIAHMRKCEVSGSHVIAKSTALHAATFGEYRFCYRSSFYI